MLEQLPAPVAEALGEMCYSIRPRERRSFHTVLDASRLLDPSRERHSSVRVGRDGDEVVMEMDHPIAAGRIAERITYHTDTSGLTVRSLRRTVTDHGGRAVRTEEVDFKGDVIGLPPPTYPEVALPFMLGWFPLDQKRRSLYAWINDRFVAKVYVESGKTVELAVNGHRCAAVEAVMYPDLNDWVKLGSVLTKLAKPFVPKYRMWFDAKAPHVLVRFEGPYGPPGAPEIVLEAVQR